MRRLVTSMGWMGSARPCEMKLRGLPDGRADPILPIDVTSRRIVPELEDAGYAVTYKEFDGPHAVPEQVAEDAFKWFVR